MDFARPATDPTSLLEINPDIDRPHLAATTAAAATAARAAAAGKTG